MSISVGLVGLGEAAQLMHLPLLADDPRFNTAGVHGCLALAHRAHRRPQRFWESA